MYGLMIYDSLMCVFLIPHDSWSFGRRQRSTCDCMRHKVLWMRPCSMQKHNLLKATATWLTGVSCFAHGWLGGGPCAGCGSSVSRLEVCKHQEGFGFHYVFPEISACLGENGRLGEPVSHLSWACHGLSCNLGIDHLKLLISQDVIDM